MDRQQGSRPLSASALPTPAPPLSQPPAGGSCQAQGCDGVSGGDAGGLDATVGPEIQGAARLFDGGAPQRILLGTKGLG
jgi:hypothetical protein